MTWSWWAFFGGIVAAFLVSFGCIVGWWFLIITREHRRTRQELAEDFQLLRDTLKARRN